MAENSAPINSTDSSTGARALLEIGLVRPVVTERDEEMERLSRQFAAASEADRTAMRDALPSNDSYRLLWYASRMAVFAIRERAVQRVHVGLTLCAMAKDTTDNRDILTALSKLHYAANRIGEDGDRLLTQFSELAEPGVARWFANFVARPADEKGGAAWGHSEVETEEGTGLIQWGFHAYDPTLDIKGTLFAIADLIAADQYDVEDAQVAVSLPTYWLSTGDNSVRDRVFRLVRGDGLVHGRLRRSVCIDAASQAFIVYLLETDNDDDARTLATIAKRKNAAGQGVAGLAEGRLFALVVGRSFVVGHDPYESAESLRRFLPDLQKILQSFVKSSSR